MQESLMLLQAAAQARPARPVEIAGGEKHETGLRPPGRRLGSLWNSRSRGEIILRHREIVARTFSEV